MKRKVLGTKDSGPKVDRRKFLTGVAVAGVEGEKFGFGGVAAQSGHAVDLDAAAAA